MVKKNIVRSLFRELQQACGELSRSQREVSRTEEAITLTLRRIALIRDLLKLEHENSELSERPLMGQAGD